MASIPLAANMTKLHAAQLAAGSEHIINGRTVRINLAGPRPDQMQQQLGLLQNDFLPQLQGMAWAGQQPQALSAQQGAAWPASPAPVSPGMFAPLFQHLDKVNLSLLCVALAISSRIPLKCCCVLQVKQRAKRAALIRAGVLASTWAVSQPQSARPWSAIILASGAR